jgi:acetyltransferase-like isoleucine patch superfamily enzyme
MKIFKETGLRKIFKFLLYSLIQLFYGILFLPPLRTIFLNILGANINSRAVLMGVKFFNWHINGPKGIKIGKDCFIGDETLIDLYGEVILEDQVTIAQRVLVLTHINVGYKDHPLQKYFPKTSTKVIFKKGAVVGAGSTILPGVIVGEKSFIAAGAVVTRSIPSGVLVGGVPAKIIRKIK